MASPWIPAVPPVDQNGVLVSNPFAPQMWSQPQPPSQPLTVPRSQPHDPEPQSKPSSSSSRSKGSQNDSPSVSRKSKKSSSQERKSGQSSGDRRRKSQEASRSSHAPPPPPTAVPPYNVFPQYNRHFPVPTQVPSNFVPVNPVPYGQFPNSQNPYYAMVPPGSTTLHQQGQLPPQMWGGTINHSEPWMNPSLLQGTTGQSYSNIPFIGRSPPYGFVGQPQSQLQSPVLSPHGVQSSAPQMDRNSPPQNQQMRRNGFSSGSIAFPQVPPHQQVRNGPMEIALTQTEGEKSAESLDTNRATVVRENSPKHVVIPHWLSAATASMATTGKNKVDASLVLFLVLNNETKDFSAQFSFLYKFF